MGICEQRKWISTQDVQWYTIHRWQKRNLLMKRKRFNIKTQIIIFKLAIVLTPQIGMKNLEDGTNKQLYRKSQLSEVPLK